MSEFQRNVDCWEKSENDILSLETEKRPFWAFTGRVPYYYYVFSSYSLLALIMSLES